MRNMQYNNSISSILIQCLTQPISSVALWQVIMYITILAFLFLCAYLVIKIVINTSFYNKNMNRCETKDANGKTECKDDYCHILIENYYRYCMVIVFFVFVFICTLTMGDNSKLTEYISFAGTISSLILSVLAIMMTILSDFKNEKNKYQLDKTLDNLQLVQTKLTNNLNDYTDISNRISDILVKMNSVERGISKIRSSLTQRDVNLGDDNNAQLENFEISLSDVDSNQEDKDHEE